MARKEHPGYVFNTMLWQFLSAAMQLAGGEVASVEDIDRAWMGVMKTPIGPFGILDLIGLDTVQHIVQSWPGALKDPRVKEFINRVRALVEAGHLGEKSGQGLYHHPQPSYRQSGFLVPTLAERAKLLRSDSPVESPPDTSGQARAAEGGRQSTGFVTQANLAERFTLHMVPRPIDPRLTHRPNFFGAAWILGENLAARALAARLSAYGATVRLVPQAAGAASAERWIADQWQNEPAPHLFLVNAWDEEDSAATAPMRADLAVQAEGPYAGSVDRRLLLPYVVCQQWFAMASKTSQLDRATLVAATALGGDFGISGDFVRADGGALTGLLKAVFMEGAALKRLGPQVKVVDFAPAAPHEAVAESLCQELALAQRAVLTGDPAEIRRRYCDIEVGYTASQRHQVRLRSAPRAPRLRTCPAAEPGWSPEGHAALPLMSRPSWGAATASPYICSARPRWPKSTIAAGRKTKLMPIGPK